jgi:hypothetical protein
MTKPKPLSSKEEAQKLGLPTISAFFPILRKPGRPKKSSDEQPNTNKEGRGRPPKDARNEAAPAAYAEASNVVANKNKQKRTNWSEGANYEKLRLAVEQWDTEGATLDENGEDLSMVVYCSSIGIPYHTFKHNAKTTGLETESI